MKEVGCPKAGVGAGRGIRRVSPSRAHSRANNGSDRERGTDGQARIEIEYILEEKYTRAGGA